MTVRELIMALLDEPMEAKVTVYTDFRPEPGVGEMEHALLNFQKAPHTYSGGEIDLGSVTL